MSKVNLEARKLVWDAITATVTFLARKMQTENS
jgi:hypothetical protein